MHAPNLLRNGLLSVLAALTLAGAPSNAHADYGDITLVGHLPFPTLTRLTNVWGHVDPATGIEYALPVAPQVGHLPG